MNFPTRGTNMLDPVFTNLSDYDDSPIQRPSFGLSDHFSVELHPLERSKQPNAKITVKSRDLRTSNRLAMRTYLEEVDVNTLLDSKNTCEEKVEMLETIVKTSMDILAPKKAKTIHSNEPPWMNSKLKQLFAKRQRALAEGDLDQYCDLRNRVNRERKLCRAKFYESTVNLSNSRSPSQLLGGEKLKNLAVCIAHQVARTLPHCTNTLIVANQQPLPCKTSLARSIKLSWLR